MSHTTVITTNGHTRELVSLDALPAEAQGQFDYVEGDERYDARFFRYQGSWYDVNEFSRIVPADSGDSFAIRADDGSPLRAWDGAQADTHFSGIVVRYPREFGYVDSESVIVGRWFDGGVA